MSFQTWVVTGDNTFYFASLANNAHPSLSPGGSATGYYIQCNRYITGRGYADCIIASDGAIGGASSFSGSNPGHTAMPAGSVLYAPSTYTLETYSFPSSATTVYTRSAYTASGSMGSVSTSGYANSLQGNFVATATPKTGYKFVQWNVGGAFYSNGTDIGSGVNRITIVPGVAQDIALVAVFRATKHKLTVVPPVGGSAKVYKDGSLISTVTVRTDFTAIDEGADIRLVATAAYNHTWGDWTGDDSSSFALLDTGTFDMPTQDVVMTANSTEMAAYDLTVDVTNASLSYMKLYRDGGNVIVAEANGTDMSARLYQYVAYKLQIWLYDETLNEFVEFEGLTTSSVYEWTSNPSGNDVTIDAVVREKPQFSASANVSDGTNYVSGNSAETAGNTVHITTSPDNYQTGEFLSQKEISVSAVAKAGWRLVKWYVNADTDITISEGDDDFANPLVFNIASDSVVTAHFQREQYTVSVSIETYADAAGAGTVTLTDSLDVDLGTSELVYHGTALKAVMTENADFTFNGWYVDGVKVELQSGVTTYEFNATQNMTIEARYRVNVDISVSEQVAGIGSAWFTDEDGEQLYQAPKTVSATMGSYVYLRAVLLDDTKSFKGWFLSSDTSFLDPKLTDGSSDVRPLLVTGKVSYVARFVNAEYVYVRMTNEGGDSTGLGELSASGGVEVNPTDWYFLFEESAGSGGSELGYARNRYFRFAPNAISILSTVERTASKFYKWELTPLAYNVSTSYWEYDEAEKVSVYGNPISRIIGSHFSIRACYRSGLPKDIVVYYATGSNSTMGTFDFTPTGENYTELPVGTSAQYVDGDAVSITAVAANGYKFAGWFSNAAATSDLQTVRSPTYTFEVSGDLNIYAKFEADTDAVFIWEGGTANKQLTWRSKRFVATKPYSPSSARVSADGYPLELSISMSDSPDAPSVPIATLQITKQDGRRIPMARPAKFLEYELRSAFPVNEVVISTSMEGLAQ